MSVWPSIRSILVILAIAIAGSGCGAGAPSVSILPTGTVPATVPDSAPPTPITVAVSPAAPTPEPSTTPSGSAQPPAASLAAEGGDVVVGQLGSYTWADGGSDSPWLPGTRIRADAGEPLTVSIADGVAIAGWSARHVPTGTSNGTGAVGLGSGGPPATFAAPASGTWSVQVVVRFAAGLGSASYYWQVVVR